MRFLENNKWGYHHLRNRVHQIFPSQKCRKDKVCRWVISKCATFFLWNIIRCRNQRTIEREFLRDMRKTWRKRNTVVTTSQMFMRRRKGQAPSTTEHHQNIATWKINFRLPDRVSSFMTSHWYNVLKDYNHTNVKSRGQAALITRKYHLICVSYVTTRQVSLWTFNVFVIRVDRRNDFI